MQETYLEQIVACKPPKGAGAMKALVIFLCVVALLLILIPYVGIFLTIIVYVFAYFALRSYNYEYEYVYVNGELDIDKIIAKSKRKRMGSFDFTKVELVAPVKSQEALRLERAQYRTHNYTSNQEGAKAYVAYVMCNNETVRLIFEPGEELLKAIQYISPRKVII